jgi:hypothetical protein
MLRHVLNGNGPHIESLDLKRLGHGSKWTLFTATCLVHPSNSFRITLIYIYVAGEEKTLKGPKCEIFGFGFFALIRPIWIGDLGTRPKNY